MGNAQKRARIKKHLLRTEPGNPEEKQSTSVSTGQTHEGDVTANMRTTQHVLKLLLIVTMRMNLQRTVGFWAWQASRVIELHSTDLLMKRTEWLLGFKLLCLRDEKHQCGVKTITLFFLNYLINGCTSVYADVSILLK